ncbi:hypothetical protein FDG09_05455 [Clostridium sporogenes]|nr:hypothetical protein [Clostridium sporogenes]
MESILELLSKMNCFMNVLFIFTVLKIKAIFILRHPLLFFTFQLLLHLSLNHPYRKLQIDL